MGAESFTVLATGKTAHEAFNDASSQAAHEYGHGGYTGTIAEKGSFFMVTPRVMTLAEAEAEADRLMGDWEGNDPIAARVNDKWGDAACIAVILSTREVALSDFEYTHGPEGALEEVVTKLLQEKKRLRRGETVKSVRLTSYSEPDSRRGYGYGYSPTRSTSVRRTKCSAQVTINKPPVTREAAFKVTIQAHDPKDTPAGQSRQPFDWDRVNAELAKAASSNVRLKAGEKIVRVRSGASQPGKPTVSVVAPKSKAVTKYIIEGSRQHGTWATGFDSQAEARAWATTQVKQPRERHVQDLECYNIVGVIRRETGEALVTAERKITSRTFEATATIAQQVSGEPDAWLFFGYASS